jgi:hypothetical protein
MAAERHSVHIELKCDQAPLPALEPGTTLTLHRSDDEAHPLVIEVERIEVQIVAPGRVVQDVYGLLL